MALSLSAHIMHQLPHVAGLYHRLLLVVAPAGTGKTAALREVAAQASGQYINVNLELSRRLLEQSHKASPVQVPRLLEDLMPGDRHQVVLLDNSELLFNVALKLDPLRCLQTLARQRTLVTAWAGTVTQGLLTYAAPEHPEYRRYPLTDLAVVCPLS